MKYNCKLCKDTGVINDGWSRELDLNGEQIPYVKECPSCGGGFKVNFFSEKEIECKCGCGLNAISPIALENLNKVRIIFAKPMYLTSACRCLAHSKNIGTSLTSAHTPQKDGLCYAFDIHCDNSNDRYNLVRIGINLGARVGIHKNFVHLDWSPYHEKKVLWLY